MITSFPFGTLSDGTPVTGYRIPGGPGAYVNVLDYGGTVQAIVVPDRDGRPVDVVLGYDDAAGYQGGTCFFGATIGRHANRIGNGEFTLDGETYHVAKNSGPNHLHGGPEGFDRKMFTAEIDGDTLKLFLVSPDMDQGFPGTVRLTVTFSFSRENALTIRYRAETDRTTLLNVTNHSYFDLSGGKNPMGQLLTIDAAQFTENDENTLPTGKYLDVAGTAFDFRTEKPVGRDIGNDEVQLHNCGGYDHNYVLQTGGRLRPFAALRSPETGIFLTAETDLPGVQLYSGNYVEGSGKGGRDYRANDAVCLESQFFPNAMAVDGFEKPILRPGEQFDHTTIYRFGAR